MSLLDRSGLSRRDVLAIAAQLGVGSTAAALWPADLSAQALPGKHAMLTALSTRPPDYETPVALLDSLITPVDRFYVRCHMPVPATTAEAGWSLAIDGEVAAPVSLTVAELKQLPQTSVTVTLECAGNGRAYFDPPVAGIQWRKGAVGTAKWTGVRVADVLERAGAKAGATHIWVSGADRPLGSQPPFVRQVPMAKASHPDTLIAWAMNDQPIPAVHGAPLRLIVPGWEGAYAIKWLNKLTVATKEFDGFWVATGYRYPTKRVAPGAAVDAKDTAPLTGLAVKSLITTPLDGAVVKPGRVTIAGFAWAGETDITKVDVSTDSGATWQPARLTGQAVKYAWRRFEFAFDATRQETHTILSRATDAMGQTQPIVPQWNPSGYLWNAPDQIRIEVTA
ncbi:MAG: sulfite oxidase [Acidobacteria bacterium]|nr:sulfite oxidase [Acidobacteriota bacterium]